MKNSMVVLFFILSRFGFAQEDAKVIETLSQEEIAILNNHLIATYEFPFANTLGITKMRYELSFYLNEFGTVSNFQIIHKNVECKACEESLYKSFESLPKLKPRLKKTLVSLPFTYEVQN
jgi:hypothetical protein